jgi:hypothetical protein
MIVDGSWATGEELLRFFHVTNTLDILTAILRLLTPKMPNLHRCPDLYCKTAWGGIASAGEWLE